jgi:hypothetical protein
MVKTTIQISSETLYRLKGLGRKGESYDSLLNRMMDTIPPRLYDTEGGIEATIPEE